MLLLNNNQGKWNFNIDMMSLLINSFLVFYVISFGKSVDQVQIHHHITHCHVEPISMK